MPKLNNIDKIRNVEWSKRYLFDVFFEEIKGLNLDILSMKNITKTTKSVANNLIDQFLGKEGSIPADGNLFEWYPITRVNDEVVNINHFEVPGTYYNHPIPKGSKVLSISVTFVDDIHNSMFNWCKEWMNPFGVVEEDFMGVINKPSVPNKAYSLPGVDSKITEETRCIKTISEMIKVIAVSKLDNQMNDVVTSRYVVVPDSTLTFIGDSDDGLHTYELKMLKVKPI